MTSPINPSTPSPSTPSPSTPNPSAPSLQDMASTMGLVLHPSDPAALPSETAVDESVGTESVVSASSAGDASDTGVPLDLTGVPLDLDAYMALEDGLNPEAHRSRPALYNSGLAKAGLVGTVGLVVCLGGASLFKVATPGAKVSSRPVKDEAVPEDPRTAQLNQAQSAASRSNAQLALQTQQQEMARLQSAEFSESDSSSPVDQVPAGEQDLPEMKRAAVTPVAVKPQPAPVRRTPSASSTVALKPVAYTPNRPSQPVAASAPVLAPPQFSDSRSTGASVDPMAEWQRLATAGRYGSVEAEAGMRAPSLLASPNLRGEVVEDSSVTHATSLPTSPARLRAKPPLTAALPQAQAGTSPQAVTTTPVPRPVQPTVASVFPAAPGFGNGSGDVYQPQGAQPVAESTVTAPPQASLVADGGTGSADYDVDATLADEWREYEAVASGRDGEVSEAVGAGAAVPSARTLRVGTSAAGHTVTPIIWAPNGMGAEAHFVVEMTAPLRDGQGQSLIPEGSQLIVQTRAHDPASGLAELEVLSVLIGGQEFTPPAGSLVIRDDQGGLLMGHDFYGNRSGPVSGDLWRVAAGALGQAGKLMNQPRRTSRSSVATLGSSSSSETIERNRPNYLGAAMEGGFEVFSDVMDRRQQAAARALAKAPKLYHLPAGHSLRVFVNQSLSF